MPAMCHGTSQDSIPSIGFFGLRSMGRSNIMCSTFPHFDPRIGWLWTTIRAQSVAGHRFPRQADGCLRMSFETNTTSYCVYHGNVGYVEHYRRGDDKVHREGSVSHWPRMVRDSLSHLDFEERIGMDSNSRSTNLAGNPRRRERGHPCDQRSGPFVFDPSRCAGSTL